jgi:hypothetical protein
MRTERTPWTCRWSEYRAATPPPIWMQEWLGQWTCLDEQRGPATGLARCAACGDWQPRGVRGVVAAAASPLTPCEGRASRLPMWTLGVGI